MQVTILDGPEDAGRALADRVAQALRLEPEMVLGVPAGHTPRIAYGELRRRHSAGLVNLSRATFFVLDEYVGLSRDDLRSFRQFVEGSLLSGVDVPEGRLDSLGGTAPDLEAECARYDAAIATAGGLGLLLLGLGANGHVGFNEPGDHLVAATHRTTLLESTRRANAAAFGGDWTGVPAEGLTIGMGTMLRSDRIVLIATGESKATAVAAMIHGGVTTQVPASLLQLHRRTEVLLDRAAAAAL